MTKLLQAWTKKNWTVSDTEHYGYVPKWHPQFVHIRAVEKEDILGVLTLKVQAGIGEIVAIMIEPKKRGTGIGKMLMAKAEIYAKSMEVHKIILITGVDWNTADFYKKLGYKAEATFKNHYANTDFFQFYKFI